MAVHLVCSRKIIHCACEPAILCCGRGMTWPPCHLLHKSHCMWVTSLRINAELAFQSLWSTARTARIQQHKKLLHCLSGARSTVCSRVCSAPKPSLPPMKDTGHAGCARARATRWRPLRPETCERALDKTALCRRRKISVVGIILLLLVLLTGNASARTARAHRRAAEDKALVPQSILQS